MSLAPWSVLAALLVIGSPRPGGAQERPMTAAAPWTASVAAPAAPTASPPSATRSALLSLVLPGAGQHRLGQARSWAYLAIEVASWTLHLEERSRAMDLRTRYHNLAWTAARLHTTTRQEGTWAYYELLVHWTRSGAYDMDPTMPGTQPESDPSTYNGWIWTLAREIYFPPGQTVSPGDPAYEQALAYYQSRAYGSGFLWDWSRSPGSQKDYARLINRSDSGFRVATIALGAVFLNHLVSAADAYLSGLSKGRAPTTHLSLEPDMTPFGARWTARLRVSLPR